MEAIACDSPCRVFPAPAAASENFISPQGWPDRNLIGKEFIMCITRSILRVGLVAALALGGLTLLVGKERVAAGISMVRGKAQAVVDRCVDDPVALRRQL